MSELGRSSPIRGYNTPMTPKVAKPEIPSIDLKVLEKLQGTLGQFSSLKMSGKVELHRKALAEDLQAYHQSSTSEQLKKTHKKIQSFMKLIDKDASHGIILTDLERASKEITKILPLDDQAHLMSIVTASRKKLAEVFKSKGMDAEVVELVAKHQIKAPRKGILLTSKEIEQKQQDYEHIIAVWSSQASIR